MSSIDNLHRVERHIVAAMTSLEWEAASLPAYHRETARRSLSQLASARETVRAALADLTLAEQHRRR